LLARSTGSGSCRVDFGIPWPFREHRLNFLIDLAPLGQPRWPQGSTTSCRPERPPGLACGSRDGQSIPPDVSTWKFGADELPESRFELLVGRASRQRPGGDDSVGVATGRKAAQEIGEPFVMLRAPDDLHRIEIGKPAYEIA
jgi:hypothetical protein